jgi:hypothetical protein
MKSGDIYKIDIPSDLGSGHQWVILDSSQFSIVSHTAVSNPDPHISSDIETYKLRFERSGYYLVKLYYLRVFDKVKDTANSKKIIKTILVK